MGPTSDTQVHALAVADVPEPEESHPEFIPLRRATRPERAVLFVVGPLMWLAGLVLVAYFVHHGDAILIALLALGGSLALGLVTLVPMRLRRVRDERER